MLPSYPATRRLGGLIKGMGQEAYGEPGDSTEDREAVPCAITERYRRLVWGGAVRHHEEDETNS